MKKTCENCGAEFETDAVEANQEVKCMACQQNPGVGTDNPNPGMIACSACSGMVYADDQVCPHCGQKLSGKQKLSAALRIVLLLFVLAVLIAIVLFSFR